MTCSANSFLISRSYRDIYRTEVNKSVWVVTWAKSRSMIRELGTISTAFGGSIPLISLATVRKITSDKPFKHEHEK